MAYRYLGVSARAHGVTVQMWPVLDGNPAHLEQFVRTSNEEPCDVVEGLKKSGAK
jgi:hypothetical protein